MASTSPDLLVTRLMNYEAGEMTDEETLDLFRDLITTGTVWHLQGSYGRMAAQLIEAGLIEVPS